MKILLIIAAGNGTRMGEVPKAISLVGGKPNLCNTIEKAENYYDKIYVVSNNLNYLAYKNIINNINSNVELVAIQSGYGCGHAVNKALSRIETDSDFYNYVKHTSICWGDVYFPDEGIFKEITENTSNAPIVIPTVFEENPYVWFTSQEKNDKLLVSSMFRKRGEIIVGGYHDQSIFKINAYIIKDALRVYEKFMYKRSIANYIHEIIFLDLVNYFHNINYPCEKYVTKYKTLSYNTEEELEEINKLIKNN